MITRSELSVQSRAQISTQTISDFGCWQAQLAGAITSPEQLLAMLQLSPALLSPALKACQEFSLRVPHAYIQRMVPGNPDDPLLRQVLPVGEECQHIEGYGLDPLAEQSQNPTDGVIHKYHGRLLLIVGGACAVNCRFCFRRHFPYQDNRLDQDSWRNAIEYIRSDTSIKEVILSGGDPLANNDRRLANIAAELNAIDHVATLRIHTRLPVVIPDRVTDELINWFARQRLQPVMVIHANHANEIDDSVREAMFRLKQAGVTLLNQAVLLKSVNDSASALIQLGEALFKAGVLPYYLHLLDPVHGAAHFDVPDVTATRLIQEVMANCPGYLVPRLVREIPGRPGKTWIL
ncbi:EF-P beta-lysylation protein EpmB [Thalassotalea sp. G20_0]|uniref:EF-P beta-lysylation protein EpmB n=1 Tax=Thalassotalea sp. G20_0 TaxID=2821093 RepID=UPI001ADD057D|nr:EF-P beta-lysylation protein EpmB [Thalassotalea sp. G20_0]MBO9495630.1 EF-P beta-lysylation protein EpmB [Thalassotalea sp. G20_0]